MATFISLLNFTDQGIRNVKDTVQRAASFRQDLERRGIAVHSFYWTSGAYDLVLTASAPNVEAMTAGLLAVASLGNVRTNTLQAFDEEEMRQILTLQPAFDLS